QAEATLTLLTAEPDDPRGLGRILRTNGRIAAIREEHDASEAERAIREVNAGVYCFDARWLWQSLPNVEPAPNGELYLTALVERAAAEGRKIEVVLAADWEESIGVNDREQLARAEAVYRRRMLRTLMVDCGVTIIDPATTYIDAGVEIAPDTTIEPNTHIRGHTRIGSGCTIGPNAMLRDARIGEGCRVFASCLEDCELEDGVDVGPYSHVRPGAHLEAGVHVGNYVEVKASRIGRDSKIGHFSYIGDALLGANVNIGAGTVTCNFDGERKHATHIGDDAFIGSDTMLVAPVRIGRGARTGAGSVVTHDVAEGETVAGVPARGLRQKRAEGAVDGR
ncbi:MAG TPA: bifunctional UDP-N-acetylglucosamine diphosphorylase/glucosamine-1-phosphate N-acetyltransferase GlmU, partial [Dehalococcoidia bacterium]|nr:bifunctional UDP-N-acetylglucosamine diphosphorylase/glucosamine-1-phosphate N-acetyltransferase GlmU [Dehalococcoidia bacterium]